MLTQNVSVFRQEFDKESILKTNKKIQIISYFVKHFRKIILIAALTLLAKASWISVKASLAQLLIAHAWKTTLTTGQNTKPWDWADTWPVAALTTPQGEKLYVLQTTSGQALAFGPGWLDQSSHPGQLGNVVIAGHRDTHFLFLEHIAIGEMIQIEDTQGITYHYKIETTEIVDSRNQKIPLHSEIAELTLTTCYPFHAINAGGPLRYVVHARLTETIKRDHFNRNHFNPNN